jgi:hypothetical protein
MHQLPEYPFPILDFKFWILDWGFSVHAPPLVDGVNLKSKIENPKLFGFGKLKFWIGHYPKSKIQNCGHPDYLLLHQIYFAYCCAE